MRSFSPERNFQGVVNRLDNIKNLGVNVIYLLPVYPIGILNGVNSPFCVKDYKSVNTEFGTLDDLRNLVDEAHKRGMAVMFDWVANHTSWDNEWITSHKDWYKQDASGNILNPSLGWKDVAQLNFANQDMRIAMIDVMKYWVFTANIDGFRCDYADGPPADFWKQAIDSLRNISTHKLLIMAEGARTDHFASGFNYIFGFRFYDHLKSVYGTNASAAGINNVITSEYIGGKDLNRVVHYTTNHDVNSSGTPLEWFGGKDGSMAAFVTAAYVKGVPLIYDGQEVGYPDPVAFMNTRTLIDWSLNPSMLSEYTKIIELYNSSIALRRGVLTSFSTADICAIQKVFENDTVFVVANLRNAAKTFTFPVGMANKQLYDAFKNVAVVPGENISLSPYEYKVYVGNGAVIQVTGLSLGSESETFNPGSFMQIPALISPINATFRSVEWSSSDTTVAMVSSTGMISGISPGTTLIIAKSADLLHADTCTLRVTGLAVTGVTLNKHTESIPSNGTSQLSATLAPADASYTRVTWESTNPDIATVSSDGLVAGVSPGNTMIIVKTVNNGKKDTCELTVTGTAVSGIAFDNETETVIGGSTFQLTYTVLPVDATNKTVNWSSENTAIATVNSTGLVSGITAGSTFVYVETADGRKRDTCEIVVINGNTFTVYFSKPAAWASSIKIYYWDPLPVGILPSVNWPGVDMTLANGWYTYTFTNVSFTNLIFNDKTKQTGNLSRDRDGWYKNDIWYDANPDPPVAIIEESPGNFNIYPNPVEDGIFTILLKSGENSAKMRVVDLQGRNVFETNLTGLQTNCSLTLLKAGVYSVWIKTDSFSHCEKLVVR
jgi:uncharacterized protein YjdB/glycosidase